MPSLKSDISIRAFSCCGRERAHYAAPALAAACFILVVRGLPLDELSVETPVGKFEVLYSKKEEKCGILLPECKLLCSNKAAICSATELFFSEVLTDSGIVRVFECDDCTRFSNESLARLSIGDDGENISASVAFSCHNGSLSLKVHSVNPSSEGIPCSAVLAALCSGSFPNSSYTAELDGVRYSISRHGGEMLVFCDMKPLTLMAPEF